MRVTKLIREYVETEVEKAYKEKTPDEVAYDHMCKDICDFRDQLTAEVENFIDSAIANFREEHDIPADVQIFKTDYTILTYKDWDSDIRKKNDIARKQRANQRDNKIKDILLNLELGATKAELDEMLKHIKD